MAFGISSFEEMLKPYKKPEVPCCVSVVVMSTGPTLGAAQTWAAWSIRPTCTAATNCPPWSARRMALCNGPLRNDIRGEETSSGNEFSLEFEQPIAEIGCEGS